MRPLSPDCVRFVLELCDSPVKDNMPELLLDASQVVPQENVGAVAGELRLLLNERLLATDRTGRLTPTLDGLWHVLQRARELMIPVPADLLLGVGPITVSRQSV